MESSPIPYKLLRGTSVALLVGVRYSSLPNLDEPAERKETTMNHKEDKRVSALLIAQLVAELVAYEDELATREAAHG